MQRPPSTKIPSPPNAPRHAPSGTPAGTGALDALLARIEAALAVQRDQFAEQRDPDALERTTAQIETLLGDPALASARPDRDQRTRIVALRGLLAANTEALVRASAHRRRALEALVGPEATYAPPRGRRFG